MTIHKATAFPVDDAETAEVPPPWDDEGRVIPDRWHVEPWQLLAILVIAAIIAGNPGIVTVTHATVTRYKYSAPELHGHESYVEALGGPQFEHADDTSATTSGATTNIPRSVSFNSFPSLRPSLALRVGSHSRFDRRVLHRVHRPLF